MPASVTSVTSSVPPASENALRAGTVSDPAALSGRDPGDADPAAQRVAASARDASRAHDAVEIAHEWGQRPTLRHYLEIAFFRAYADLRSNAVRLYLGTAWWVLEPAAYVAAYYIAFAWIMNRGGGVSVGSLLTGIVLWKWFASSLTTGASSIAGSGGLIRLVWLPKFLLPLTTTIAATFRFLFVMPVLLGFLAFFTEAGVSLTWVALPLALTLNFLLNLGAAALVGAIVPFVRDLRIAIDNLLLLMMFVSGVFFELRAVAGSWSYYVLHLNPVASMLDVYRAILIRHEWPHLAAIAFIAAVSLSCITIGLYLARRYDGEYAKVV